jgi:hypothetical protein
MRLRTFAHITTIALFALLGATETVWACGNAQANTCHEKAATEPKGCCAGTNDAATSQDEAPAACCGETAHDCAQEHPDQPCGNDDGNCCGKCHCPYSHSTGGHSFALSFLSNEVAVNPTGDIHSQRQAFYFADHLPEAVYLPIWQPPQIAA